MEISKNVTWKPLGEKVVAVKVETGEYYTMNEVASLIWKALNVARASTTSQSKSARSTTTMTWQVSRTI